MRRIDHLCPDYHEAGKTNSSACEQYDDSEGSLLARHPPFAIFRESSKCGKSTAAD